MGKNGGGNNRERKMDGESTIPKAQLKGLQYDDNKPAFLRNALAALTGGAASSSRQAIPQRPDFEGESSDEHDLDGEDAPAVVVLKGKHIDRDEVDQIRADAKANDAADPISATAVAAKTKQGSSLNFSTSTSKRKINETDNGKSWDEVVKRSKADDETAAIAKKVRDADDKKGKEKGEKAKLKKKKVEAKKVSMLSFDDE